MTRFVYLDRPLAYPFFDIVLRDTNPGGCFDLSVLLEDYTGSLYLRQEHVIEMARSLGMATVDEVAAMKARIQELEGRINRLPEAQEELKNGLAKLVGDFHSRLLSDGSESVVGDLESDPFDRVLEEAERETERPFSL